MHTTYKLSVIYFYNILLQSTIVYTIIIFFCIGLKKYIILELCPLKWMTVKKLTIRYLYKCANCTF